MPARARQHTVAGAKAFVKYFWGLANYAQRTLDDKSLAQVLGNGCAGCHGATAAIRAISARGGSVSGGRAVISRVRVTELATGTLHPYAIDFHAATTQETVGFPGGTTRIYPPGANEERMIILPTAVGWEITDWEIDS